MLNVKLKEVVGVEMFVCCLARPHWASVPICVEHRKRTRGREMPPQRFLLGSSPWGSQTPRQGRLENNKCITIMLHLSHRLFSLSLESWALDLAVFGELP